MDDQMTKIKLLNTLYVKRAEWDALLATIPMEQMSRPGVTGAWSVKDIVAHITYHECWYADRLHEMLHNEVYIPSELDFMDFDARNERIFQQNRHHPVDAILAESRQAFQKLVDAVDAHSETF